MPFKIVTFIDTRDWNLDICLGGINAGHNKDHKVQSDHQVGKIETWKYLAKGFSDYAPF